LTQAKAGYLCLIFRQPNGLQRCEAATQTFALALAPQYGGTAIEQCAKCVKKRNENVPMVRGETGICELPAKLRQPPAEVGVQMRDLWQQRKVDSALKAHHFSS
jgi:hypothetical protein